MTPSKATESKERRRELDFLRGIALVIMTVGHPLRADMQAVNMDFVRHYYSTFGELFSAMFMFMSAINVQNFIASAKKNPNLNATKFYLKSSVALYVMGTTYNMIVGTLPVVDIIQAIALGTLFSYFLLKYRVSTFALAAITIAFFAAGLLIVGPSPLDAETMRRIGRFRYFIAMFGPIPWLGFFSYGLLVDRLPRGKFEIPIIVLAAVVFGLGHLLPSITGTKPAIFLFKANLRYIVLTVGLLPLLHLSCRRWYRGVTRAGRMVESWGVESLIFLVFHWSFIYLLRPWQIIMTNRVSEGFAVWSVGVATLVLMALSLQAIVRKRNAWLMRPDFWKKAWSVFLVSLFAWAVFQFGAMFAAKNGALPLVRFIRVFAVMCAFGAAFAFSFLYPAVRAHFRNTCTRGEPANEHA